MRFVQTMRNNGKESCIQRGKVNIGWYKLFKRLTLSLRVAEKRRRYAFYRRRQPIFITYFICDDTSMYTQWD